MKALRQHLQAGSHSRVMTDPRGVVELADVASGTILGGRLSELAGACVLIAMRHQMESAIVMLELDGVAKRMLLCPPDLDPRYLPTLMADAGIDTVVCDDSEDWAAVEVGRIVFAQLPVAAATPVASEYATEWLMLTSGTTGAPKIVSHSLEALTGAIVADGMPMSPPVWATFYDIRRYGGLQIFLRAMLNGGSMVLSDPKEAIAAHLTRLSLHGVTHISGTPSHWRKALMSGAIDRFAPKYVRLSGEIADQAVLDSLRTAFPKASIGHAYASTEAGVGFAVNDGLEGFPASLVETSKGGIDMRVEDGTLWIRSPRTANAYVGRDALPLMADDGFIDTGDMVERHDDRFYFVGRRSGIINVGGLKVHPEEVEAVINRHGRVRMSRVKSRKSPITGSIVIAEIVVDGDIDASASSRLRDEIIVNCRAALPVHKVPAMIKFVPALDVTAAGKMVRTHA